MYKVDVTHKYNMTIDLISMFESITIDLISMSENAYLCLLYTSDAADDPRVV